MDNVLDLIPGFSLRGLLVLGLMGAAIWGGFRLMNQVVIPLVSRRGNLSLSWNRISPLVEACSWTIFAFFVLYQFLRPNPLVGGALMLLVVASLWASIRDFMTGLLIRLGGWLSPGQNIRQEEFAGQVLRLGNLGVELELENGEILAVPYHKLAGNSVIKGNPSEQIRSHAFEMHTALPTAGVNQVEAIRRAVMNLPWSVGTRPPRVELIDQHETYGHYRIILYSSHERYFPQMESIILGQFSHPDMEVINPKLDTPALRKLGAGPAPQPGGAL
ncbi:MAG: hypothetical protein AAFV07_15455 [Bacteroidota bacterium]